MTFEMPTLRIKILPSLGLNCLVQSQIKNFKRCQREKCFTESYTDIDEVFKQEY